ncbi:hypothetical protein VIGAN_09064200 [Vigna angularis var. angularis]|uniref:Uncharacterized protein n=1 Tax=Vigna angularis var. angularis TaxID=157739 RepID=A0A0S3SWL2_PHAAN|nr:hypothetical protein VIGAN_09064200 [Vigna angularis var. angularis]
MKTYYSRLKKSYSTMIVVYLPVISSFSLRFIPSLDFIFESSLSSSFSRTILRANALMPSTCAIASTPSTPSPPRR